MLRPGGTVQPFPRTGYHMFGSDMGELHADLDPGTGCPDDGAPIVGDQGDQWTRCLWTFPHGAVRRSVSACGE